MYYTSIYDFLENSENSFSKDYDIKSFTDEIKTNPKLLSYLLAIPTIIFFILFIIYYHDRFKKND